MLMMLVSIMAMAQGQVKGFIKDKKTNEALSFVSVVLSPAGSTTMTAGATTDADGAFTLSGVKYGQYTLNVSFVGYKTITRQVNLSEKNSNVNLNDLKMEEDATVLKEVSVTGQRSTMKLEVDRKSFDVSSMISSAGQSASEVLESIPSVEVDNDGNVSLRGNTAVEVWINGRASGLTADNRAQILQQIPAESIERIEVIDNPSSKYSAEGSAGIINIVLKKNRKAGYNGSVMVGADTRNGAQTSVSFNYSSSKLDAFASVGYNHRENIGKNESTQTNFKDGAPVSYENHSARNSTLINMLFSRAGFTWHATDKDDFSLSGMLLTGKHKSTSYTPYYYGNMVAGAQVPTYTHQRDTRSGGPMNMYNVEFNYRHNFTEKSFLDFIVSHHRWGSDMDNIYHDSIYYADGVTPTTYSYESRPLNISNKSTEGRLDFEGQLSKTVKLEAGYNVEFSRENTPQESYAANNWNGDGMTTDKAYYNKFYYNNDIHALYATLTYNKDKFGIQAGLRGEYWRVKTESLNYAQAFEGAAKEEPFKKDYFQLFPSLFMSYQLTKTQQLQLNYTRRLRRPWGGQLNSFKNTSDASIVSFGNPLLTPEYSNSFSLNYLKTWEQHSLLVSAYYRPTTDVIQRLNYRNSSDNLMYSTSENVAKSTSTGIELTAKNKLWRILDITTNVNGYYYKLNAFDYQIDGQTVSGKAQENFTWNARLMAALTLPYDISLQASARYSSRQATAQGHRPSSCVVDFGVRKTFLNRLLIVSVNCRDVFNSRKWETYTSTDTFERYQINQRSSRTVNLNVIFNFGNTMPKQKMKKSSSSDQQGMDMEENSMGGYEM